MQGGLEYIHEKPINQQWQNTFSSYMSLGVVNGKYRGDISIEDVKVDIPKFNLGFSNTIGFYPNTRTSIHYRILANYDSFINRISLSESITGLDGERIYISNDLNIEYFISPRFSISIASNVIFGKFYTNKNNFTLDQNLYNLISHPFCESNNCNSYVSQKKNQLFNFMVSIDYNLF